MTLFISILLINGFSMSEWLYPLAVSIWMGTQMIIYGTKNKG